MTRQRLWMIPMMMLTIVWASASAQEQITLPAGEGVPDAQAVSVRADDRLTLHGDFYLSDPDRPTVLLLHQLYTTRASWQPLLAPLHESGYNVLAVDLRGFGATRGMINWFQAVDDVQIWLDWLRAEGGVRADDIHMMGSSMGATLAINGCAADDLCRSVIALSPGWDYYRVSVAETIAVKPVLAIYTENDRWPALGVPRMIAAAPDTLSVDVYAGNAHGMDMVTDQYETLVPRVLAWLAAHDHSTQDH